MALATMKKILHFSTFSFVAVLVKSSHNCISNGSRNSEKTSFASSHCAPTVQMALESLFLLKSRLFESDFLFEMTFVKLIFTKKFNCPSESRIRV
mmetsp:Transcript_22930/g.39007  ORF Transcript_22930/g.39007 Transcript_22930/m.39007 type:complete len:95 (+) Transcript_22930:333-617(+)